MIVALAIGAWALLRLWIGAFSSRPDPLDLTPTLAVACALRGRR